MPIMPIAVDLGRQEGTNARSEDPAIDAAEEFADQLRDRGVQVGEVTRGQAVTDVVLGEVSSAPMRDPVTHLMHYSDNPLSETLGRMVAHSTGAEPSFEGAGAAVLEVLADLGIDVEGVDLGDLRTVLPQRRHRPGAHRHHPPGCRWQPPGAHGTSPVLAGGGSGGHPQ